MVRLALLSAWHVHTQGFLQAALDTGLASLTVVWDDDEARGKACAEKFGAVFDGDLDRVLARSDIDAVMVEAATVKHKEIIVKAANAKKHIFSDKVLALTVSDCLEIKEAIEKNGVKFVQTLESKTIGSYRYAKKLADEGKLGCITAVYYRRAHQAALDKNMLPAYWFDASQTGGGVTLDLGCHGLYLLPAFCGKPKKVNCMMNELYGTGNDEISTTVVEFESGAIGTAHTSFVTDKMDDLLEIIGTEGLMVMTGTKNSTYRVLLHSKNMPGYESLTQVPADEVTKDGELPSAQFVRLVADPSRKTIPEFDIDNAITLTRMVECAYQSAKEQKTVLF